MVSLDSEDLVRHLVELLHLAFSQQLAEVLDIFRLLKGTGNREFLLLLFGLVAIVVPDGYVPPTALQLSGVDSQLVSDRLFWYVLIGRLSDRVLH